MAAQQTCANMPHITISKDKMLKTRLSKYKKQGNLMTAALLDKVLTDLRMALEALPEDSQALSGSLDVIFDTGCSYVTTGFKEDFRPCILQQLKEPILLDGIGSRLKATHQGITDYEYIDDKGDIQVLTNTTLYMLDLKY